MSTHTTLSVTDKNRSGTPPRPIPKIQISKAPLSDLDLYLNNGELLVSKGYPAPPRNGKEIRICKSCNGVYLIVHIESNKIKCGYCINDENNQQLKHFEKLKIN